MAVAGKISLEVAVVLVVAALVVLAAVALVAVELEEVGRTEKLICLS